MKITSGNKETEFAYTSKGNFMMATRSEGKVLVLGTRSVLSFLKAVIAQKTEGLTEFDHQCEHCHNGFASGKGVMIEGVKFCVACREDYKYFDYFRKHTTLTDHSIYYLTDTQI